MHLLSKLFFHGLPKLHKIFGHWLVCEMTRVFWYRTVISCVKLSSYTVGLLMKCHRLGRYKAAPIVWRHFHVTSTTKLHSSFEIFQCHDRKEITPIFWRHFTFTSTVKLQPSFDEISLSRALWNYIHLLRHFSVMIAKKLHLTFDDISLSRVL